jgi:hypothetical protein
VQAVRLTDLRTGGERTVACRTVVLSGGWVPDAELLVSAGCQGDERTRGSLVTAAGATTRAGLWAAGNVVHPAEAADVAALGARHVAAAIACSLAAGPSGDAALVRLSAVAPLRWVVPGLIGPHAGAPARGRLLLRSDVFATAPALTVRQGETKLWRGRVARLAPGRSASIPASWLAAVDPAAGAVKLAVS